MKWVGVDHGGDMCSVKCSPLRSEEPTTITFAVAWPQVRKNSMKAGFNMIKWVMMMMTMTMMIIIIIIMFACLSVRLPVCLSHALWVCLSASMSVSPSVSLSTNLYVDLYM